MLPDASLGCCGQKKKASPVVLENQTHPAPFRPLARAGVAGSKSTTMKSATGLIDQHSGHVYASQLHCKVSAASARARWRLPAMEITSEASCAARPCLRSRPREPTGV